MRQDVAASKYGMVLDHSLFVEYQEFMQGKRPKSPLVNKILSYYHNDFLSNVGQYDHNNIKISRSFRASLAKNVSVLDSIYRSFGILQFAKLLSNDECLKLLSYLRFGIEIGVFENIDYDTINHLMTEVQPATLMKNIGKKLTAQERDQIRAEVVRTALMRKQVPVNRRLS